MSSPYKVNSSFSIQAALMGLPFDMFNVCAIRLNEFQQKLWNERQLMLRDDSRLVWSFVSGQLPGWTEAKVMDELCLVQYLHSHTDYVSKFKCTIPIVKLNIEQQVFAGMDSSRASSHAYEYVQKFVIPLYRIQAMFDAHPDHDFPVTFEVVPPIEDQVANIVIENMGDDPAEEIVHVYEQTLQTIQKQEEEEEDF